MKKTHVLHTSVLLLCFFLLTACGSQPAPNSISEPGPIDELDALEPTARMPSFKLFHPTRGIGASPQNDRYFSAIGNTQRFYLPRGTRNNVARVHARIEAYQTSDRFEAGYSWKGFEADYSVLGTLPGQVTVTQLYAAYPTGKSVGPQVRIEVRDNGDLKAAFGDGNPVTLATRGTYNRLDFNVRIMSNGKVVSVYLDGERKVGSRELRFQNKVNLFRWGLYYNEVTPRGISSTMKNIRFYGL